MIYTPKKIPRSKVRKRYIPLDYSDDTDGGFFDFTHYGKEVFKPRSIGRNTPRMILLQIIMQMIGMS